MKNMGAISFYDFNDLSLMGFTEITPNIFKILKIVARLSEYGLAWNPDVIISIESPDFSLKISKKNKSKWPNAKTIHYVAPSVWAWRPNRAKKMSKYIDHVLAILPFEPNYMR